MRFLRKIMNRLIFSLRKIIFFKLYIYTSYYYVMYIITLIIKMFNNSNKNSLQTFFA